MTTAAIRYITNGYIVQGHGGAGAAPESVYALTIPEVVYWLGRIFDPIVYAAPPARERVPAPQIINPPLDPLLGQTANVVTIATGGFLVQQNASMSGAKFVEVYCVDMDAVSTALTQIFTPPAQE